MIPAEPKHQKRDSIFNNGGKLHLLEAIAKAQTSNLPVAGLVPTVTGTRSSILSILAGRASASRFRTDGISGARIIRLMG